MTLLLGLTAIANISLNTVLQETGNTSQIVLSWLNIGVAGAAVVALAWFAWVQYNDKNQLTEKYAAEALKREEAAAAALEVARKEERERSAFFVQQIKDVVNAHGQAMSRVEVAHTASLEKMEAQHAAEEDRRLEKQLTDTAQLRQAIEQLVKQIAEWQRQQNEFMERHRQFSDKTILAMERLSTGFGQVVDNISVKGEVERIRDEVKRLKDG